MESIAEKKTKISFSDSLVEFIQKHRTVLFVTLASCIGAIVISGVVVSVLDSSRSKAIGKVEEFAVKYDAIHASSDDAKKEADSAALVTDLTNFAEKKRGYAAARAFILIADIRADRKEWNEAEQAWLSAAESSPKSYMAPVSIYNAATAAEERGDGVRALELYTRSVEEFDDHFPLAPRAYFAIGRLNEERKDFDAATAAYKKMVDSWPNDGWTKLANSRILFIASQEKK